VTKEELEKTLKELNTKNIKIEITPDGFGSSIYIEVNYF